MNKEGMRGKDSSSIKDSDDSSASTPGAAKGKEELPDKTGTTTTTATGNNNKKTTVKRPPKVQRVYNYHIRDHTSTIKILEIKSKWPELFNALQALPHDLAVPVEQGIYLQPKFYKGLFGSAVFLDNILERKRRLANAGVEKELPNRTIEILRLVQLTKKFMSYDNLLKNLREDDDWGDLVPDQPFLCSYCDRKYTKRSLLDKHFDDSSSTHREHSERERMRNRG